MKYLIVTCFIALASFTARAQTAPAKADSAHTPTIVYVNQDTLMNNYEYFKAVKAKLQDISTKAQNEIEAKTKTFQNEVAAYRKRINSLNLAQRTATEKRLAQEQQNLETLSQNTAKQMQEMEADENAKLYDRIGAYLKTYTKAKGYKIVLTYSKSNPAMLYGDESLDVTKDVLAGLNADYKAGK
ncbi:MAG TPA: OmpH family outer membrane protein [Mucilaginibacter sp.]|nr:OmpH family outer membrane protein [Mucilaginibacter sp.]